MSVPPSSPSAEDAPEVGAAVDRRECWYCLHADKHEPATCVVHDKRGCMPCCQQHARWRRMSLLIGHKDCPLGKADGAETGISFEHVTVYPDQKR